MNSNPLKKNIINKMLEKSKRILKREKAKNRKNGSQTTETQPEIKQEKEV